MLIFLPFIALIFLLFIIQTNNQNWRDSILSALIGWGVILTIITELLSLSSRFTIAWVALLWLLVDIGLVTVYVQRYRKRAILIIKSISQGLYDSRQLPLFSIISLSGVALIVALVGLVAIAAAPNHSDSMEYHMSRVMHWIQNASVAHYPTHSVFHLHQNPWSEFAIAHWQILSGGDRFANLVQWGSMVGSIVGVTLIAQQLGATRRGQILAAVVCATIPMGILQGSSTNNDYVVALWLVCFAYFALLTMQAGASLANISRLGVSLGLAILTKGTAYFFAFPFCIWLALWGIVTLRWKIWKPLLMALTIALAINLGHYIRNVDLFGSPLGPSSGETNEVFTLPVFISTVTKNLALHTDIIRLLGLESIFPPLTGIVNKAIRLLHDGLGIDINDPRIMSPRVSRFYVPGLSLYEDTAGNPLHLLIILLSIALLAINKNLWKQRYLLGYCVAIIAGFSLFCFFLTWSPWRCRLHLPLFVLFAAFVGSVLSQSLNFRLTNILAVLLLFVSHPWVLHNSTRPLIGESNIFVLPRTEQYFATQPKLMQPYIQAVEAISSQKCSDIGLVLKHISFEYPLWMLFEEHGAPVTIRHLDVDNESAAKANQPPFRSFTPCATIRIDRTQPGNNLVQVSFLEDG
jgi:hypothetical protein